MKEFIEYLVKEIVTVPDKVVVTEVKSDPTLSNFIIDIDPVDMGIVIGKEGRNIRSIRDLVLTKAIKDKVRIRISIKEQNTNENL